MRYSFSQYTLDTERHELRGATGEIHLQPKVYLLLETLLGQQPRAFSKDELHEILWPSLHVSDASLARLVSDLRKALGESASQPVFIRTVQSFGYRFDGAVSEGTARQVEEPSEAAPQHVLESPTRRVYLHPGDNEVGRDSESVLFVDSVKVSRRHCCIRVRGDEATLEDLGSKNGTYLRGEKIEGPVLLQPGDVIDVGPMRLVYGDPLDTVTKTLD